MSNYRPILKAKNFGYADTLRSIKNRAFGFCASIRNLIPTLGDGERVRCGYTPYTGITTQATDPSGNALTVEVIKNCPIQQPTQEDVIFQFGKYSSNQYIYMTPYWITATKQTDNMVLNESKSMSGITVSYDATGLIMTPAVTTGWSSTTDYYKGWVLALGGVSTKTAIVTAYNGTTKALTFLERVDASGLNLGTTLSASTTLYRNFHGGLQADKDVSNNDGIMSPTYNTGLSEPPNVISDNSRIYLCGGQTSGSATSGARPIFVDPHLKRTWFSGGTKTLNYEGTYVEREELRPYDFRARSGNQLAVTGGLGASGALTNDKTYWLAIAPVYDGYQIGQLYKYETIANYTNSITGSNYNYVPATGNYQLSMSLRLSLATLNKRITGLMIYMAQDTGQTLIRQTPYFFITHVQISPTAPATLQGNTWSWDATLGAYTLTLPIDNNAWSDRGNTYQQDTGCSDTPVDETCAYSLRTVVGARHYIGNFYVNSESGADKQSILTNPLGGNATINNTGIPQVSRFNTDNGLRFRLMPTIGSRINAIMPSGGDEVLVIKDRGIISGRLIIQNDFIDISPNVIDSIVGMTTTDCWAKDDDGWIYFPSYSDIYRYRSGSVQALIQRIDGNDWSSLYNDTDYLTSTDKEACAMWYQPQLRGIFFCFKNIDNTYVTGFNDKQFALFPDLINDGRHWRQIRFNEQSAVAKSSFKYLCTLRNGTVIGLTTEATPKIYIFAVNNSGTMIFQDYDGAGAAVTAIVPYLDSGDFNVATDESKDFVYNKLSFTTCLLDKLGDGSTKYLTTMGGGNLDISFYLDQNETATPTATRTATSLSKTATRINVYSQLGEKKVCNFVRFIYNANATPMAMSTTATHKVFGIDSIELYGDVIERRKRVGEN